nr:winged helix-turn-helix domain-containing protein [Actinoplanes sp. TFC3]
MTTGSVVATIKPPAALTVTFNIPLTGESLPPQARRLLEAVCELVEAGDGSVEVEEPLAAELPAVLSRPGVEVRLLLASRQVLVAGELMPLTRLEFDLLQFLADHPRRVFSRTQLLTAVWGYEHTGERTVDVHVRRLRVKMNDVPLITTVYGVGYRLADDALIVVDPQG